MATVYKRPVGQFGIGVALALSLLLIAPGFSYASSSKHSDFQAPVNDKLGDGSAQDSTPTKANDDKPVDLSPVTLEDTKSANPKSDDTQPKTDDAASKSVDATTKTDSQSEKTDTETTSDVKKATVTANDFVPKGPADGDVSLEPKSIKPEEGEHGKGLNKFRKTKPGKTSALQTSKEVKLAPAVLTETVSEMLKKEDTTRDAERLQLEDLWEAALNRSPNIQFVIEKLLPTDNAARATTMLTRSLSTAIMGGAYAAGAMMPGGGAGMNMMSMPMYSGAQMMQGVLSGVNQKAMKKANLTDQETCLLYMMVQGESNRLVERYRSYKKYIKSAERAQLGLQDLQTMVAEAGPGKDAAVQIEMQYTLGKAQREIDDITDEVKRYRQDLIDISGAEALDKLDVQLAEEKSKLTEVAGAPDDAKTESKAETKSVNKAGTAEKLKKAAPIAKGPGASL